MPPTPLATTAVQEQCVRARLGELFAVWITMPEHTELVEMMRRETLAAARVPGHDVGSVTPTRRSSAGADDSIVPPRGATAMHGANYRFQSVDEMDRRALSPGGSSPISPGSGARVVDPSLPLAASPESRALSNPRASPTEGGLDARHMRGQRDTAGPTTSTSSVDWGAGHGGSLAQSITHLMRQASPSHQAASYSDVPPFFFARGRADSSPTGNAEEQRQLAAAFSGAGARGIKRDQIHAVCRALDVPVWMSGVVFNRLAQLGNQSHVELTNPAAVVRLAEAKRLSEQLANLSPNRRLFELMRGAGAIGSTNPDAAPPTAGRRGADSLSAEDLVATTRSLVEFHAGLEFLSQEEFQAAYCRTVAYRMLYLHDPLQTRAVSWPEFDRSRIPTVLRSLDQTTDINSVLEFFSYEHFYVLYCRFWELDTDKDGHVSLSDLRLYSRGTINPRALQRVVEGRGRRLTSAREGYLNFEDFVYFCLSEEDKTSVPARRYWFNVLDLDGDGILSGHELGVFFEEQRARLQEMMYEPVRLEDIICQMFDMITPHMLLKQGLRFEEVRRCEGAIDVFFNVFVNAEKFMAFETRNPSEEHQMRQMSQEPTAWDRFARAEYDRLAQEAQQQ